MMLGFRIEMRVFVNGDSGSVVWNIPRSCCFFVFSFFLEIFWGIWLRTVNFALNLLVYGFYLRCILILVMFWSALCVVLSVLTLVNHI